MTTAGQIPMEPPQLTGLIDATARGLELAGVAVILIGVATATVVYLVSSLRRRDMTAG